MIRQPRQISESPTITRIREVLSIHGAIPAGPADIAPARALAERRMQSPMADAETIAAVQARSGVSVFVAREANEIAGVMGFVLLTPAGAACVVADRFDALNPAQIDICARNDEPAAIYGWGIATTSHSATKTLATAAGAMGRQVIPHLRWYMRTVTADGERLIMKRQGWRRVPGSSAGLIWMPSVLEREGVAA